MEILPIISIIVAVASALIMFHFYRLGMKTSILPVLIFVYNEEIGWKICNLGMVRH